MKEVIVRSERNKHEVGLDLTEEEKDLLIILYIQKQARSLPIQIAIKVMQYVYFYIGRDYTKPFVSNDHTDILSKLEMELNQIFTTSSTDLEVSVDGGSTVVSSESKRFIRSVVNLIKHRKVNGELGIRTSVVLLQTLQFDYKFISSLLGDASQDSVSLVYNSRVFKLPNDIPSPLHWMDISLFVLVEDERLTNQLRKYVSVVTKVNHALSSEHTKMNREFDSVALMAMASFCGSYSSNSGKRYDVTTVLADNKITTVNTSYAFEIPPNHNNNNNQDIIQIVYVFNPLSKAGQRAVSLFPLFEHHLKIPQLVLMTPAIEITEFPLQNYYRFVLPPIDNNSVSSGAVFNQLPVQHTLTIRTDVPEAWNVQAFKAHQDIDNLRCTQSKSGDGVCGDPITEIIAVPTPEDADVDSDQDVESVDSSSMELTSQQRPKDLTRVTYILKSLIVPGQCFESSKTHIKPPAGLQLLLKSDNVINYRNKSGDTYEYGESIRHSDTLVMHNLGYFQLQANPGVWRLTLAPGRADSLYSVDDVPPGQNGLPVFIHSFGDAVKRVFVTKKSGLEHIKLLDDSAAVYDIEEPKAEIKKRVVVKKIKSPEQDKATPTSTTGTTSNMWKSLSSLWKQSGGNTKYFSSKTINSLKSGNAIAGVYNEDQEIVEEEEYTEPERIHIFSLATGHMYERLLRIMMLSVTKRTSMPVKFWLFENYLSPTFKQSAELMSIKYGFEIGYVTYKWPSWLTQQSEKQRIIWGYKILFLDVLFPISVKRIIYVDSDQVIRADLKELWNIDMGGKPYGYVPFCSSRNETLGFQFWRSGFWHDHLRGLPYHISALYLIDLQNFRRRGVGDILRSTYDGYAYRISCKKYVYGMYLYI